MYKNKPLKSLTREEHEKLSKKCILWELYPETSGDWEIDTQTCYDAAKYLARIDFKSPHWNLISVIDWPNKGIEDHVVTEEQRDFFSDVQRTVYNALNSYGKSIGLLYRWLPVSDDGFDDLTAHIVGLGAKEVEKVIKYPKKALARASARNYKENFMYCFSSLWPD